jgi:ribonuclease BN (tRNA processing enzyme)
MHADHFFDLAPLRYACKYGEPRPRKPIEIWLPPRGRVGLEFLRKAVSIDATPDFFDEVFTVKEYDPNASLVVGDMRLSFSRTLHYVEGYAVRVQRNGAALTYSADTAPCDAVIELARGSSLFLCEAALGLDTESGARGHSSAQEAGTMAARAGVERLVLTHYPAWYSPGALVEAAQRGFGGYVEAASDGLNYVI